MIIDRVICTQEGGVRLDAAILHAIPSTTRAFVKKAIASGMILIQTGSRLQQAGKGLKLRAGTRIFIRKLMEETDNLVLPCGTCPEPIYEDENLLVFDKPPEMPVQPLSPDECGTLANAVALRFPECRTLGDRPLLGGALHRIDANTSGLVLFARSSETFDIMRDQFSAQTIKKTYLALVEGSVLTGGHLEGDLVHDPTVPFCRMIYRNDRRVISGNFNLRPLHAVTEYSPIGHTRRECEERTLLKVVIRTGVTHQIRAQLAHSGMHIINDRLYGAFAVESQRGHCLHAYSVDFLHPRTNQPCHIQTALPEWALSCGITDLPQEEDA